MTQASTLGMFLGSAVVSAIVSMGYNHFFVSKKDLLERELNFVSTLSTVLKEQKDRDELGRLTFVTNVLHPLYVDDPEFSVVIEYFMRAKSETNDEIVGTVGNTLDSVLTRAVEPITTESALETLEKRQLIPTEYSIANLRDGFFSGYRRQLSDKLVAEINEGSSGIADILLDAIISDDPKREYRVNLYIAFTLARANSWSASAQKLDELAALKQTANYQDSTFKKHLDEALRRYQN